MKKKKSFYCLYKSLSHEKFQVILLAQKAGIVSLDYLFEKAAEFDLEHIFTPQGGSWANVEHFLAELLKKKNQEMVWLLDLEKYNQEIITVKQAELVYNIFESAGKAYPSDEDKRNLRSRFLKI